MADAGKAARVIGFVVFQLGAGIVLDTRADVWGGLIVLGGAAAFIWGLWQTGSARAQSIGQNASGGARC